MSTEANTSQVDDFAASARRSYPIFQASDPPIYLDSAATALKPRTVVEAVTDVLVNKSANIHRSVHRLGDLATEAFESSRQVVADFIGAESHEIVFVRNTTEAINVVASQWPLDKKRVVLSLAEHHSNILPWTGNVTMIAPNADTHFDVSKLTTELERGDVEIVTVSHVSNVLGSCVDLASLAELCHAHGALLAVDGAQSVPHQQIDVYELDCDFLFFSGHKLGSPSGVGVLYAKAEHLDRIDWHLRGGSTVESVSSDSVVPKDSPWRLEAGTPAIECVVGLAAAIEFIEDLGMDEICQHQRQLVSYALKLIQSELPQMEVLGPTDDSRVGPISMVQRTVSPHQIARGLSDGYGVCARSGFHCAQPLHESLGVPASLRLSTYVYNSTRDIDVAVSAIGELLDIDSRSRRK